MAKTPRLKEHQHGRQKTRGERLAALRVVRLPARLGGSIFGERLPPANRLEKLKGNRSGQYSIRINDQWRICFTWRDSDAHEVEIVDYH
jgi:proteic killer suppression protein